MIVSLVQFVEIGFCQSNVGLQASGNVEHFLLTVGQQRIL